MVRCLPPRRLTRKNVRSETCRRDCGPDVCREASESSCVASSMDEKERTRSSATAVLVCLSVCLTSMPLSSASVDRRRRVLSWTARRGVRLLLGLVRLSVSPPPRCPWQARQQRLAGPGSPSRDGRPTPLERPSFARRRRRHTQANSSLESPPRARRPLSVPTHSTQHHLHQLETGAARATHASRMSQPIVSPLPLPVFTTTTIVYAAT